MVKFVHFELYNITTNEEFQLPNKLFSDNKCSSALSTHHLHLNISEKCKNRSFQELVQNGDDSGATQVRFTFDETCYDTNSLFSPEMQRFQVNLTWSLVRLGQVRLGFNVLESVKNWPTPHSGFSVLGRSDWYIYFTF